MTKAIAITYDVANRKRSEIAVLLMVACGALMLTYAFALYNLVSNTVAIKDFNESKATIDMKINELDTEYLSLVSNITPDILSQYGLKEGETTIFISKSANLGHVSLGANEL